MSATIFVELVVGIFFMSAVNSGLEMVRKIMIQRFDFFVCSFEVVIFLQATKEHYMDIIFLAVCVQASTGTVLLFCYVGSITTSEFLRYGDISYQSDWFRMTINQQKCILLIIVDAQRPLIFDGLGIIDFHLPTFVKVLFRSI